MAQKSPILTRASASFPLQVPTAAGKATDAVVAKGRHERMSAIEASETPEPLSRRTSCSSTTCGEAEPPPNIFAQLRKESSTLEVGAAYYTFDVVL
jgi:hypothetical protein